MTLANRVRVGVLGVAAVLVIAIALGKPGHTRYPAQLTAEHREYKATLWQAEGNAPRFAEPWGAFPRDRAPMVTDLAIRKGSASLAIPAGACLDLARAERMRFEHQGQKLLLVIEGGGDGLGYRAELHFENGELSRRIVRSRAFSETGFEDTRYSAAVSD